MAKDVDKSILIECLSGILCSSSHKQINHQESANNVTTVKLEQDNLQKDSDGILTSQMTGTLLGTSQMLLSNRSSFSTTDDSVLSNISLLLGNDSNATSVIISRLNEEYGDSVITNDVSLNKDLSFQDGGDLDSTLVSGGIIYERLENSDRTNTSLIDNIDNESAIISGSQLDSEIEGREGGGKIKGGRLKLVGGGGGRLCAVCGDRALGCNFDVISCESCKAFFRRNALKEQQMKCLFSGCCDIDINTRRFCSYCRLQKCLSTGMKKHLILDDDERRKRMEKVKKNREKRKTREHGDGDEMINPSSPSPSNTSNTSHPSTEETKLTLDPIESLQPLSHYKLDSPHTLKLENTNLLTLARLMSEGGTMGRAVGGACIPSAALDSLILRRLTAEETHLVHELNQVYDLSFTVDLEPLIHIRQLDPSLNQLVNQSSITVLRLIKFAKRLTEFVQLSQECQISILKGCWIHMLLLRSVSLYDCERDVWVTPRGDIPTEILMNATGFVQLHDDHIKYCKSIKSIIGNDLTIVVILLVLVLFSPDGTHVISRELVSNIQDRYIILLKHYLEAKYTYDKAADMFPRLISKVRELDSLAESHCRILLDLDPQEIEPIMLEILDLKSSAGR